jgi:DNA-binding MarR family transcriptional regulator
MTATERTAAESDRPATDRGLAADARVGADPRLATWRLLLLTWARLSRRLDDELRSAHDVSLPEVDALLTIAQAPNGRLRMSQLASEVELSRSGVTRLIDRLVDDGFVERCQCSHDARGAEAVLTPSGERRLQEALRTHLEALDRYLLGPLDPDDRAALERALVAIGREAGEAEGAMFGCRPDSGPSC